MRVGLGVTGGIAAYKAADLLRLLQDRGLDVQVIMTAAAREFVTPLTFAALSGRKVITDVFETSGENASGQNTIEHISVAQEIDVLVIAPATADVIAKMAHGIADDFLTTLVLATRAPVIVAPAMNVRMWEHAATQANISALRTRGLQVVDPGSGYLACGMTGAGRLADVQEIANAVFHTLCLRDDFRDETVLVTAGPTREPIDPVRYLGNRSSGKMGYAVAKAAQRRGARVILISGPVQLQPPPAVTYVQVETTVEMAEAVFRVLPDATAIVMTAAVADFQSGEAIPSKMKRRDQPIVIKLKPTPDILSEICKKRRSGQIIVGFAAETDHLVENALAKLRANPLNFIVANDVTQPGAGFDVDTNIATLMFPDGRRESLPQITKFDLANRVLDEVIGLRQAVESEGEAEHLKV
ncbi:MAG TPA: bifunctional phosphopantothenoylcysteine decarboxylase/phosphopantothenate--cysteine ligase CoaBC [Terriglobia bacterium]|nr:bifunctional phosphopantothenoylcysteine decarboxylase/phosphopantothenate--cysteine ligase CoaBC [Terriglobia bacterium]